METNPKVKLKKKFRLNGARLLMGLVGTAIMLTMVSLFPTHFWLFELASHFPVQYCLALLIIAPVCLFRRQYVLGGVALAFGVVNGTIVYSAFSEAYATTGPTIQTGHQRALGMLANVDHYNQNYERLNSLIEESKPDLVVLLEVDQEWIQHLTSLNARYSNRIVRPNESTGVALFSRFPVIHSVVRGLDPVNHPWIQATLDLNGEEFVLIGAHPPAPVSGTNWLQRNRQLHEISRKVSSISQPAMILGDLNITPWSPYFKKLLKDGNLIDWRTQFGWNPTWPAGLAPFWIPIDHVLGNRGINITKYWTGRDIGSDHYPVFVEFSLHSQATP